MKYPVEQIKYTSFVSCYIGVSSALNPSNKKPKAKCQWREVHKVGQTPGYEVVVQCTSIEEVFLVSLFWSISY